MKIQKTILTVIAVMALGATAVQAQTSLLFKVQFNATAKPPRDNSDNKINNKDLIRRCVGDGFSNKEIDKNFALVFNAEADALQVVNKSDGSQVCDVFLFEDGTNVVGNSSLNRLVFVFLPGNPDSVGSAVITERAGNRNKDKKINGKIQFSIGEGVINTNEVVVSDVDVTIDVDGSFIQSVAAVSSSDAQICTGTFTVGKAFVSEDLQSTANDVKKNNKNKNKNKNKNNDNIDDIDVDVDNIDVTDNIDVDVIN